MTGYERRLVHTLQLKNAMIGDSVGCVKNGHRHFLLNFFFFQTEFLLAEVPLTEYNEFGKYSPQTNA